MAKNFKAYAYMFRPYFSNSSFLSQHKTFLTGLIVSKPLITLYDETSEKFYASENNSVPIIKIKFLFLRKPVQCTYILIVNIMKRYYNYLKNVNLNTVVNIYRKGNIIPEIYSRENVSK